MQFNCMEKKHIEKTCKKYSNVVSSCEMYTMFLTIYIYTYTSTSKYINNIPMQVTYIHICP